MFVIREQILIINKQSVVIFFAVALFITGCSLFGGKPGLYVNKNLKAGMTKIEALEALSEGASHLEEVALHLKGSDSWNELLKLKPVRESMKDTEKKTDKLKAHHQIDSAELRVYLSYFYF